jgi:hypothetical protein
MKKLMTAQDLLKYPGGPAAGAFNSRGFGHTYNEVFGYPSRPTPESTSGFYLAEKMIGEGRIFSIQRFRHKFGNDVCRGQAFPYGGDWVCNKCGQSGLERYWWQIKVYKDGNAWCCVGIDFVDLQASDNFAFGDTRDEAIKNYETLKLGKPGV